MTLAPRLALAAALAVGGPSSAWAQEGGASAPPAPPQTDPMATGAVRFATPDDLKTLIVRDGVATTGLHQIVFLSSAGLARGVRKDRDNPLGTYSPVPGTQDVAFRECGKDDAEIIPLEMVVPTTESCRSKPGETPGSLQLVVPWSKWQFDAERGGFLLEPALPKGLAADGWKGIGAGTAFIACEDLPSALLVAAGKASSQDTALAGSAEALARLDASGQTTGATDSVGIPAEGAATASQCRETPLFWTSNQPARMPDTDVLLLSVTQERPGVM